MKQGQAVCSIGSFLFVLALALTPASVHGYSSPWDPRRLCPAGTPPDAACAAANPCMSPELGLAVAIDARKADHSGVQDLTLAPILADNATIGCVWLWLEYQDTSLAFAVGGDANNKDLPAVKEWAHKGSPSNMKLGPTADGKTVTLATGNGCAFTFTVESGALFGTGDAVETGDNTTCVTPPLTKDYSTDLIKLLDVTTYQGGMDCNATCASIEGPGIWTPINGGTADRALCVVNDTVNSWLYFGTKNRTSGTDGCWYREGGSKDPVKQAAAYQCACIRDAARSAAQWMPLWFCPCGSRPALDSPFARLCRTYDPVAQEYSMGWAEMRIDGDNAKNDAVVCHTPMATTQSSSAAVPEVEAYETDVLCLPCSAA